MAPPIEDEPAEFFKASLIDLTRRVQFQSVDPTHEKQVLDLQRSILALHYAAPKLGPLPQLSVGHNLHKPSNDMREKRATCR